MQRSAAHVESRSRGAEDFVLPDPSVPGARTRCGSLTRSLEHDGRPDRGGVGPFKLGFKGKVYCTHGTGDLLQILLPDSGYLQEEDAARANRHGYTRHDPAEPLYTEAEARRSLRSLRPHGFDEPFEPCEGVTATFTRAGHIVGSACLALRLGAITLTFSGAILTNRNQLIRLGLARRRSAKAAAHVASPVEETAVEARRLG